MKASEEINAHDPHDWEITTLLMEGGTPRVSTIRGESLKDLLMHLAGTPAWTTDIRVLDVRTDIMWRLHHFERIVQRNNNQDIFHVTALQLDPSRRLACMHLEDGTRYFTTVELKSLSGVLQALGDPRVLSVEIQWDRDATVFEIRRKAAGDRLTFDPAGPGPRGSAEKIVCECLRLLGTPWNDNADAAFLRPDNPLVLDLSPDEWGELELELASRMDMDIPLSVRNCRTVAEIAAFLVERKHEKA